MDTGPYVLAAEPIELNAGRTRRTLAVSNTGDRAIQVSSHFHFFEVNRALRFDRAAAFGMRLDIPSGTALRFEPGDTRPVDLVPFGGTGRSVGFNALTDGSVRGPSAAALERARRAGFWPSGVESGGTDVGSGADRESRAPGVSHRAGAGSTGHAGREGGA